MKPIATHSTFFQALEIQSNRIANASKPVETPVTPSSHLKPNLIPWNFMQHPLNHPWNLHLTFSLKPLGTSCNLFATQRNHFSYLEAYWNHSSIHVTNWNQFEPFETNWNLFQHFETFLHSLKLVETLRNHFWCSKPIETSGNPICTSFEIRWNPFWNPLKTHSNPFFNPLKRIGTLCKHLFDPFYLF